MGKAIVITDLSFATNIGTVTITESGTIDVTSVTIIDKPTSIINSVQLTASVLPSNATNKAVTWSSSNTSVATVNSSGLVTVIAAGTVTITATSQADNTKSDSITIQCSNTLTYPTSGLLLKLDASGKNNTDADATTWADESGNGNNFTLSGFDMTTTDGWDGQALVFKGAGLGLCRSVTSMINGGYAANSAITVICRVMIATNGRRVVLDASGAHAGGNVNDNYVIQFDYGSFMLISKETKPTNKCTWNTNDLGVSKLIGVVRQNLSGNKMSLYNSKYGNTSVENTFSLLQPSATARPLQIGLLGNSYGRMDGKIYDIMLYNRELSDEEISQIVSYLNNK